MKIPLFDVDWTLLRGGNEVHRQAFVHTFLTVWNMSASVDEIEHQGMTDKQIYIEILLRRGTDEGIALRSFSTARRVMVDYFLAHQNEDESPALPGVVEILERLRQVPAPCGLLTGNVEEIARCKLQKAGLGQYFSFGAFGDLTTRRVDLVEVARKQYQQLYSHLDEFCVVGDAPRDIECAKQASIPVVAVASGKYSKGELQKYSPDLLLSSLEESDAFVSFLLM